MNDDSRVNYLVENNINLARFCSKKFHYLTVEFNDILFIDEEIYSEALIGLFYAAQTFNDNGKAKFSTYAVRCIKNQILKYITHLSRKKRKTYDTVSFQEEVSMKNDDKCLLEEATPDNKQNTEKIVVDKIDEEEFINGFKSVYSNLTPICKTVISQRINHSKDPQTIANELEISRAYVYKILNQTYIKILIAKGDANKDYLEKLLKDGFKKPSKNISKTHWEKAV